MSSAKLNPNSYTEELFQRIISGTDAVLSRLKGSANTSQHIYSVAVIVFSLSFFHLARTLTNSSPFAGVQPSSRDLTSTTDRTNLIGLIRYLLCLIVLVVVVPALHAHQLQPAPGVALQGPDHYTFRVGDVEITALSDGTVPQDLHVLLRGTTEANTDALLRDAFQTNPVEASINVFLFRLAGHLILVDAGSGDFFGPGYGGKLLAIPGSNNIAAGQNAKNARVKM